MKKNNKKVLVKPGEVKMNKVTLSKKQKPYCNGHKDECTPSQKQVS